MPLYQTIGIFLAAVLLSALASKYADRLKADLSRPIVWLGLLAVGTVCALSSSAIGTTRHSGTGLTTSYGWPKPFYFRYLSETGAHSDQWVFHYLAGNALVFTAGLMLAWTAWRVASRRPRIDR